MRLIEDEYSELRFSPLVTMQRALRLDLTEPSDLERLRLVAMESRPTAEGLLLTPTSNDPIIAISGSGLAFNRVTVTMRSRTAGHLEVFWARGSDRFAAERRRRVAVEATDELVDYTVDLAGELDPGYADYRLRVDPLDRQAPFVIRSIEIGHATFDAEPATGPGGLARKVRLGRQVREALVVAAGRPVEKRVQIAKDAVLRFALGRSQRNETDVAFALDFVADGGDRTPLLEEVLPRDGEPSWMELAVPLQMAPGTTGRLVASVSRIGGTQEDGAVAFWAHPVLYGGDRVGEERPNVLLISLDTVGSSHLTPYGSPATRDPFLTAFARRGVVFDNSFASSSLTHVSHGSLMTGRGPLHGSLFWLGGNSISDLTLAEALRQHGYLTAAFTGGVLVTERLGFDHGFDLFHQQDTLYQEPLQRTDIRGLLQRAESWVATQASPWFLFVHSYEAHAPYFRRSSTGEDGGLATSDFLNTSHMKGLNPISFADAGAFLRTLSPDGKETPRSGEKIDRSDVDELASVYRGEIAYLDRALDDFFAALRDRGLLDDTLVVITSDHGEAFFEHGLFEHGLLYDENLRVPLLMAAPGRLPAGVRVTDPVYAPDVAPTILEVAGLDSEERFEGRSLVAAMRGEGLAASPGYAFVPGNGLVVQEPSGWKLILRLALLQENFGRDELFDRTADAAEKHDRLVDDPQQGRRLAAAAEQLVGRLPGAHISLSEFAGHTCRLTLTGSGVDENRMYARGLTVDRRPVDYESGPWSGDVTLHEAARLVVLGGRDGKLDVELACDAAPAEARFSVDFARLGEGARPIRPASGTRELRAWRVEPASREREQGGLAAEDREQLRALGYL